MANEWACPFCNRPQIATNQNTHVDNSIIHVGDSSDGQLGSALHARSCLNESCKKTSVILIVGRAVSYQNGAFSKFNSNDYLFSQQILPQGCMKPQPDFIPVALREDYSEACLIRDLSPKASATLTRRCLQGMIRNFAGISKSRLVDEIDALRQAVNDGSADRSITPESVDAIDHVRGIGNIGAHMEKDIDHIVPVDAGEAQAMIDLIEMLFEEWYVAREQRKRKLAKIANIAADKKALKSVATSDQPNQS